jgi:hypothetical protein
MRGQKRRSERGPGLAYRVVKDQIYLETLLWRRWNAEIADVD